MITVRTAPEAPGSEFSELNELRQLHALNQRVDSLIEEAMREHSSLARTFQRLLPAVLQESGAQGLAITTRNEELVEELFTLGEFGARPAQVLLDEGTGTRREAEGTWVCQTSNLAQH